MHGGRGTDALVGGGGFDNPEIIDNSDPEFGFDNGNPAEQDYSYGAYKGGYYEGSTDNASWTFANVPAGDYELLLSWPSASNSDDTSFSVEFASQSENFTVDQSTSAVDVSRSDYWWYEAPVSIQLLQSGDVVVDIFGDPTLPGIADAVWLRPDATSVATDIFGSKFHDYNANGVWDASEHTLEDWMIFHDANDNGFRDEAEIFRVTDRQGSYNFNDIAVGTYLLREESKLGWLQTYPDVKGIPHEVDTTNSAIAVDFGNRQIKGEFLIESDRFLTEYRELIDVSANTNTLAVRLTDLDFDLADQTGMNDAVELALLRLNGTSWVDTIGNSQDAYFNSTELEQPLLADGVTFGGDTVVVDISHLPSDADVTLVARLVNNDADTTTSVIVETGVESQPLWGIGTQQTNKVDLFFLFDDTSTGNSSSGIDDLRDAISRQFGANDIPDTTEPNIQQALSQQNPGIDFGFGVGRLEGYAFRPGVAVPSGHDHIEDRFDVLAGLGDIGKSRPFILNQPIVSTDYSDGATTLSLDDAIIAALGRESAGKGGPNGDNPETVIEALFQVATGRGFDGDGEHAFGDDDLDNDEPFLDSGNVGSLTAQDYDVCVAAESNGDSNIDCNNGDVPPFRPEDFDAPVAPGDVIPPEGNRGGVGFREGTLPVVILAYDTATKYGTNGADPDFINGVPFDDFTRGNSFPIEYSVSGASDPYYGRVNEDDLGDNNHVASGQEATIDQALNTLLNMGAIVIGYGNAASSGSSDVEHLLSSISLATNAVNTSESSITYGGAQSIPPDSPLYFNFGSIDLSDDTAVETLLTESIGAAVNGTSNLATLFQIASPFSADHGFNSFGQLHVISGPDEVPLGLEVGDMTIDANGRGWFIANEPFNGSPAPNLFSIDLDDAWTRSRQEPALPPLANFAGRIEFTDFTSKVATGLAFDSDVGVFYLAVNDGGADSLLYQFHADGANALQPTQISTIPAQAGIVPRATNVQSIDYDSGSLVVTTVDADAQDPIYRVVPDTGEFIELVDTELLAGQIPTNVAIDPVTGRTITTNDVTGANLTNLVEVLPGDNNNDVLVQLTNIGQITEIQGAAFVTPVSSTGDITPPNPHDGSPLNVESLEDVSGWFEYDFHVSSFAEEDSQYSVDVVFTPKDDIEPPIRDVVAVGLKNVSHPLVRLAEPDGVTRDGTAIVNVSRFWTDESTGWLTDGPYPTTRLAIENPHQIQFDYDLAIFAQLNQPPAFTSQPAYTDLAGQIIEVHQGTKFKYQPLSHRPRIR